MSYAPSDVWQTRLLKKILSGDSERSNSNSHYMSYLESPNTSRIIDDLDDIYLQLDHKRPIFLDILTSKKLQILNLVRQQEFCRFYVFTS